MQKLQQNQKSEQRLSPQQIQLLQLLALPSFALVERINQELEINPALEENPSAEVESAEKWSLLEYMQNQLLTLSLNPEEHAIAELIIGNKTQEKLETLVNQILDQKSANPNADTSALENQIDQLVYQLYGLTEEEIKIIENK
jgi:DNA-directed RNA polymerase specialized sigma54-like protein